MNRKRNIIIIIALSIILIVLGATLFYILIHKSTPSKTIEAFEKSIKNNDINGMISCLTPNNQEYANELIQAVDDKVNKPISLIIDAIPFLSNFLDISMLPNVNIVLIEEQVYKDTAEVKVKLEIPEKISINADINMVRIKNKWLIESLVPKVF